MIPVGLLTDRHRVISLFQMDAVECTHCQVTMTSWSTAGSPVRYFQCPLCARTHSSQYDEVFRARAGARRVDALGSQAAPSTLPMASLEDRRWATVRARASRWFTRLESEQRLVDRALPPPPPAQRLRPGPGGAVMAAVVAARPARHR
jgi:hypothetical protein